MHNLARFPCLDDKCPGEVRLTDTIVDGDTGKEMKKNGQLLMEGHCRKCKTDHVGVYIPVRGSAPYRAREIPIEREYDGETISGVIWIDNKGNQVGWYIDDCFRLDLGSFHMANDNQISFDEAWFKSLEEEMKNAE